MSNIGAIMNNALTRTFFWNTLFGEKETEISEKEKLDVAFCKVEGKDNTLDMFIIFADKVLERRRIIGEIVEDGEHILWHDGSRAFRDDIDMVKFYKEKWK